MAYKELKLEPGEANGLQDILSAPPTQKKKSAPEAAKPRKAPAKKSSKK